MNCMNSLSNVNNRAPFVLTISTSNFNFTSPVKATDTVTYMVLNSVETANTSLPGWYITTNKTNTNLALANNAPWGFTSPSSVAPYTYTQFCMFQIGGTLSGTQTCTLYQNVTFSSGGNYTLTYYIQARPTYYNTGHTIYSSINGYSTTPYSFSANGTWISQSLNFALNSPGIYTLSFVSSFTYTGNFDSSIGLSVLSIGRV